MIKVLVLSQFAPTEDEMIRTSRSILLISLFLVVSGQHRPEGLWPLVTPLLGVSDECFQASKLYIEALSEAFTSTGNESLSEEQKEILLEKMFDWLDTDNSGKVTFFEFKVALMRAYIKRSLPEELLLD